MRATGRRFLWDGSWRSAVKHSLGEILPDGFYALVCALTCATRATYVATTAIAHAGKVAVL